MRRHSDGRAFVHVSENTADLIAGEVDLSEWDDEELYRGYTRAKDGSFRGRPPTVVPIALYQEFIRRQLRRAEQGFVDDLAETVKVVKNIARDENVDPDTRLRAANMIFDRALGKPKDRIELVGRLEQQEPHERVIEAVTVDRSLPPGDDEEDPEENITDAEVVDDDEPEPTRQPKPGSGDDWRPTYGNTDEEDDDEFVFD